MEWGGGVGYGEFSKGCNSPEGGPLASQHCFALLCSLERGFFLLNPTDYVENGGKRMMVWYSCTCRQVYVGRYSKVQVVSELGTESSPTRSYQGKGKGRL